MKARTVFQQDGQTLILVAVSLVVLMGMIALAVDVGHLYGERRRMQNAADAGALAGAREICFGDPGQAAASAREYAITRNGAQTANVTIDGGTVEVIAGETVDAFFAGIIGMSTTDVEAVAAASCGQAEKACGLWPVAFDYGLWYDQLDVGCGKAFYVWTGDNDKNAKDPDCDIYDCDVDNDGEDDIFPAEGRGWLDFTYALEDDPRYPDPCIPGHGHGSSSHGCGTKELSCWLLNNTGAPITLPACIDGDNGTRAATKDEVMPASVTPSVWPCMTPVAVRAKTVTAVRPTM